VAREVRALIRRLSAANPLWGAPRLAGELAKIGIAVPKSTVEKYRVRRRGPASPTWMTFLRTHAADLISTDFFVVPTVNFQVLFVFLVHAHIGAGSCTSMSPPTPPHSGPGSKLLRLSPTSARHAIYSATAITSTAKTFNAEFVAWRWSRFSPRRVAAAIAVHHTCTSLAAAGQVRSERATRSDSQDSCPSVRIF
jgi:hypothetical protein